MLNKKIVLLGGGTGLPTLLKGIKNIENIDISAIVTVSDNGGSTGILSKQFKIPAVGDLRRVLIALSNNSDELSEVMEYRFNKTNSDLDNHSMGNLILATQILIKGDLSSGIKSISKVLNISGKVIPISNEFNELNAKLDNGEIVVGETSIGNAKHPINQVFYNQGKASNEAINSVMNADLIILGIGSLYTSLIPNLIFSNMIDALKKTKAKKIYFANIFTQNSETTGMMLKEHVEAIENHTYKGVIDKIIFSNTNLKNSIIDEYKLDGQFLVKNNYINDVNIVLENDLSDTKVRKEDGNNIVCHSPKKIEKFIISFIQTI